ncbi:MAG: 16S rRNA (guanine(966)-N(2))-methyltransferase RsmD [Xanthomonadales bacterium]|nr:16S rRNA (guanine(966)-N(2))-methyltransferase RsmD [Xanthomonadales bacterium]
MKNKRPGTVRIIGGKWRGTRLPVPDLPGLRPSGDRGRETLFNWLQHHIRGADCADLFAGSGVLGLEAASRGAASVTLIENSTRAATGIRESLLRLKADGVSVVETNALDWLAQCDPETLDIAFIDPPFGSGLETRAVDVLTAQGCIRSGGFVYIELARDTPAHAPGPEWEIVREKVIGEVRMQLLKKA